eukprot:2747594-Alexandrium_andersonii.AAC.1
MTSSSAWRALRAPASRGLAAVRSRGRSAGLVPSAACMAADVGTAGQASAKAVARADAAVQKASD